MHGPERSALLESFPAEDSPLRLSDFFDSLYAGYDERFVVSAPDLARVTWRLEWDANSPGLQLEGLDYPARLAG